MQRATVWICVGVATAMGCAAAAEDPGAEAASGGPAIGMEPVAPEVRSDAAQPMPETDAGQAEGRSEWLQAPDDSYDADLNLVCESDMNPALCDGDCPDGQGCCITGVRPLGVCRTLDECNGQCALDCGLVATKYGFQAAVQCESLCTFVGPTSVCRPDE